MMPSHSTPLDRLILVLLLSLLAACASRPALDTAGVDTDMTPREAVETPDEAVGRTAHWGGTIISSTNLEDVTELEVLAYPLDRRGHPNTSAKPLGRFLIIHQGYLETVDFGAGRVVSTVGEVREPRKGRIGESEYTYPVLATNQVHLWSGPPSRTSPQFRIGVGVLFVN